MDSCHGWRRLLLAAVLAAVAPAPAWAQDPPAEAPVVIPEVVVRGHAPVSAAEGEVDGADLADLPVLRRGELLEAVPGMVVTQHSGDGKANQYFLRGFNLDHGTDFAFSVDGVPVNLPSHAHGQGYSDLNFLIPELMDGISFKKGPFYPEVGDFSGAGAADITLVDRLPEGIASVQGGQFRYARALVADSPRLGPGRLLYAVEYSHDDGPWALPEHSNRANALLRYHWDHGANDFHLSGSFYWAPGWQATDQIPKRAVSDGLVSRFGAIDQTDGGNTARAGLSFDWTHHGDDGATTHVLVYGFYYRLNLWSDFDYFLNDPVNGDQFEQIDRRFVAGLDLRRQRRLGGRVTLTAGLQIRGDDIPTSGLNDTVARRLLRVVVADRVREGSAGVYLNARIRLARWLRADLGVRGDVVAADVASDTALNSGRAGSGIAGPKATVTLGPWRGTSIYVDAGTGFHSNDGRGATITVDPTTLEPQTRVPLLVRTKGAEIGARTSLIPDLVSTLSLWILQSDSELTFSGDSGDTEANGPSRKYGVEWANVWKPATWLSLTGDLAVTHARYLTAQPTVTGTAGTFIANSIPVVVSGAAVVEAPGGLFAGVRVRYFGAQPLIEDDTVRQPASTIVNALAGYRWRRVDLSVEALNLLDARADDIAYYYPSRLPGETGPVNDVHFHPAEPFQLRVGVALHH